MKRTALFEYKIVYPDAIHALAGTQLKIGKREARPEWSGWIWCSLGDGKTGWVPERNLRIHDDSATLIEDYDARELALSENEAVEVLKTDSGWAWVKNSKLHEGWVPVENLSAEIETKRLLLQEHKLSNLDAIHALASDPEVAKHSSWGPRSLEETKSWLGEMIAEQKVKPRLIYEWAITERGNSTILGTCRLGIKSVPNREAYIGYTLAKAIWGKGYATEISRALVDYAFQTLKMHRVFATTSPLNIPSQRVLEKTGMIEEGTLRKNVLQRGEWRDSVVYAILSDDE